MSEATQDDIVAAAIAAAARVQVVNGTPDEIEVAALVAGLAAVAGASIGHLEDSDSPVPSQWMNRARTLGVRTSSPGSDQWRWSLRH